jgi:8-oxo-dGTP diphosphatase
MSGDDLVEAAGGVVMRLRLDGRPEVALVHRPAYDDWSLPKGKLHDGERHDVAALREVAEETGLDCELGPELPSVSYRDRHGHPKTVRYYVMRAVGGNAHFEPTDEVDEVRWLPAEEAADLLSYDRDREVLRAAVAR